LDTFRPPLTLLYIEIYATYSSLESLMDLPFGAIYVFNTSHNLGWSHSIF